MGVTISGVRLTIGQFVGILLLLGIVFCIWKYWWMDQDRNTWINRMNNGMMDSNSKEDAPVNEKPKKKDGWL